MMSFALQELFNFISPYLFIVSLRACTIGVLFCLGSCLLHQCIQGFFLFSLLSDLVYPILCWGLWSTWIWVLCRVINMDLFVLHIDIQLDQHHLLEILSFCIVYCFHIFYIKNQVAIGGCNFVWVFNSVSLIMSVFMPILWFHYYGCVVELEMRDNVTSRRSFINPNNLLLF